MQDPRTGVQIGIRHKKGGLYELEHLYVQAVTSSVGTWRWPRIRPRSQTTEQEGDT